MATDPKAAARSARAYLKRKHTASAELAGGVILDSTITVLAPDGHYVIYLHDDTTLHTVLRDAPLPVVESSRSKSKGTSSPRVYAPKAWSPDVWNRNVEHIRSEAMTKDAVITWLADAAQGQNTPESHKQAKQAIAVIEALPDTPDWFDHLPLAQVS